MRNCEEADVVTIWSACGIPFLTHWSSFIYYENVWFFQRCISNIKWPRIILKISGDICSNYGSLDTKSSEMYVYYVQRYNTLLFRSCKWRFCIYIYGKFFLTRTAYKICFHQNAWTNIKTFIFSPDLFTTYRW